MPRPRSEEIPLELIKRAPASGILDMSPKVTMPRPPRAETPKLEATRSDDSALDAETPPKTGQKDVDVVSITSEETSFTFPDTHGQTTTTMTTTTRAITSVQEETPSRRSSAKGTIETV